MITTKQRAFLRSLANGIDTLFQIGKNGIEENFIKQVDQALEKRELIKINVLESAGLEAKEASRILTEKLNAEGVQVIGNRIVLYRQANEASNRRIELPKK